MSGKESADADTLLEELSDLLAQAEERPDNVSLLRQQIYIMRQLQMTSEMLDVYIHLSSLIMVDEGTWRSYFEALLDSVASPLTLDTFVMVLERFDQAERDYLSPDILAQHLDFVLSCWRGTAAEAEGDVTPVDSEVAEFLNEDTVRSMLSSIAFRGQGLLSESDRLWQRWLDWEMVILAKANNKSTASQHVHSYFLTRLAVPHLTVSSTSDAYSTFCSQYCPESYEQRLVQATEVSQEAKMKLQEKRYGKTREDLEQQIQAYASDFANQAQVFISYTRWEADDRARQNARGKTPASDPLLSKAVFERTVRLYALSEAASQTSLDDTEWHIRGRTRNLSSKGKGKNSSDRTELEALHAQRKTLQDSIRAYKDAEASIWSRYAAWADESLSPEDADDIRNRAVRACPQNGDAWCQLILHKESRGHDSDEINATFKRALALGQLAVPADHTSDLAKVFVARAASEARVAESQANVVLAMIIQGLEAVQEVNKGGDNSLRLEKFLLDWVETKAPEFLAQALQAIDKPIKARASAYQMVLLRTGVETRQGNVDTARDLFAKAIQRSDLDWPEAVYEGYLQFEDIHGSSETVLLAKQQIAREQDKLAKRREKVAREQAEVMQAYVEAVEPPAPEPVETMDVDQARQTGEAVPEADVHLKRDREHTTILITGMPKGVEQDTIGSFFEECGIIREITMLDEGTDALVEFRTAESVPAALTRDHKRIEGQEVSVSMLWRSTLFITNFSREMDDEAIRALFSQYGRILQTRWPSRKYADSRRFCYVTMESPAAAQEALILHGYKTGDGFGLTVLLSDPSAKTKRSDISNSTLFVGGLNAKTTEVDVRGLLRGHGNIQSLKLGWDPIKRICKGFAFVEMSTEAEAQAALSLHGSQFQGRYLKVELSDPNHGNKKSHERNPERAADRRSRSVKLSNLPPDTQEGLLQQALEKLVPVKRLEIFAKDHEAVAELEAQADVGKLLLRTEPFLFGGNEIGVAEQVRRPPPNKPTQAPALVPRAARRAKLIGKPRAAPAAPTTAVTTHDQGDFRAMVAEKNLERGAAGEKRRSDGDAPEAKRSKP